MLGHSVLALQNAEQQLEHLHAVHGYVVLQCVGPGVHHIQSCTVERRHIKRADWHSYRRLLCLQNAKFPILSVPSFFSKTISLWNTSCKVVDSAEESPLRQPQAHLR
jgi:hypothetical protein